MGVSDSGSGSGTIFSRDVSDLCAHQIIPVISDLGPVTSHRSQVRGNEDYLPYGSSFHLLLGSYHSGFVGTISTLFCYVNIKLSFVG